MKREDVKPEGQAPGYVKQSLLKIGGKNPFKEPMYRMVLAQYVLQMEGGEWHDYPDYAEINERGGLDYTTTESGLVMLGENSCKPERVVVEMRWTERYPDAEGWLLQRWYPADYYPKDEWEKFTLKSHPGIALLGPYPTYGNYEECTVWQEDLGAGLTLINPTMTPHGMVSKYTKAIPPLRALEKAIISFENRPLPTDLAATREQRIKIKMTEWVRHEEARRKKRKEENLQRMHDYTKPMWGSSLEAARLRNRLAEKAGIKSHVGA